MTSTEQETVNQLCILIQSEKDPSKFTTLVNELDELLEQKERRCNEEQRKDPSL